MVTWLMAWDDGYFWRLIHNIIPKVSLQPINCTRNEILFFTGHEPFPSYLHRFNLAETSFCTCGVIGTLIHSDTECLLAACYHMVSPSQQHKRNSFRRVANNSTSRRKVHKDCNACDPIQKFRPAFSQIATSNSEHPLPPAMNEFKISHISTVHPTSSSLPLHTILFLWRWKVSLHQFNIHLHLLSSPSSPNEFKTAFSRSLSTIVEDKLCFTIFKSNFHQLTLLQNRTF
ncbi:hypothetical protein AVEN_244505-1 [Araneus ventricosus]|uniref:Uncharacterized protein n=1 Tax=Araneus ventricosus TaxID=182803 RepID=A0A4Y2QDP6_ARAVE|nr:hypothetical protein AVEN_244505-1 [Araneus ventricosus]